MQVCAILDIILGIVVFNLQVIFFVLGYVGFPVYVVSGFWGGVIFFSTGVIALSNEPHLNRDKIMGMIGSSYVVGVFLTCFYLWQASYFFDGSCGYYRLCEGFYIEIGFIVSGIFGIIINAVLHVQSSKLSPVIAQQPQLPYYNRSSYQIFANEQQHQPYSISDAGYNTGNPLNRNEVPNYGGAANSSNPNN